MRPIRSVALLIATALVGAACQTGAQSASPGATATGTASTSPAPTQAEKVTLTFLAGFTGGDRPAYEGLVKQFNDSHPNIQVQMDIQPWDSIVQELPAAIATGAGPDIATPHFSEGSIFDYAKNGSILPLDDAYGSGGGKVDKTAIPQAALDAFTYKGQLYAAPANFATLPSTTTSTCWPRRGLLARPSRWPSFATMQ